MASLRVLQEMADFLSDLRAARLAQNLYLLTRSQNAIPQEPDLRGLSTAFGAFERDE
jgi:hypothetical protein